MRQQEEEASYLTASTRKDRQQQQRQQRPQHQSRRRLPLEEAHPNTTTNTRSSAPPSKFRRRMRPSAPAAMTASPTAAGNTRILALMVTACAAVGLFVVWSHGGGRRLRQTEVPATNDSGFVWLRQDGAADGSQRKHGHGAVASVDHPQQASGRRRSRRLSALGDRFVGDESAAGMPLDTTAQAEGPEGVDDRRRVSSSRTHTDDRSDGRERTTRSRESASDWEDSGLREDGVAAREGDARGARDVGAAGARVAAAPFRPIRVLRRKTKEYEGRDSPQVALVEVDDENEEEEHSFPTSDLGGSGEHSMGFSVKHYESFEAYATEQSARGNETLPVPIVSSPEGPEASRSIPLAIIIGTQKGGTQNLRSHLLTHPSLSGLTGKEAHFFDWFWFPSDTEKRVEWPGDGLGASNDELSRQAVGDLLSTYADRAMDAVAPNDRDSLATVESTPVYIFYPLTPYRMKMVLPQARLIVILRDPTERYFSHLRMHMCWTKGGEPFSAMEKRLHTYFHTPGEVKAYLKQGEASYEPYTPLCRGEKATARDLLRCWGAMQMHNPLHRGLYADQLERWFRVYPRSQILVVESSEMFGNFTGTLHRVARHIGLPPHDFSYDSRHQHSSSLCERNHPELFAEGGRYDKMLEDESDLREWYRPHNQRLYRLLGHEIPWV